MKKLLVMLLSAGLLTSVVPQICYAATPWEASTIAKRPRNTRGAIATYTCTGNNVNVRKGPGTSYDVVGQIMKNTWGLIYEISDDNKWALIDVDNNQSSTGEGFSGWCSIQYLKFGEP